MRSIRVALIGALLLIATASAPVALLSAPFGAGAVAAASPTPGPSADSGDTRSTGEAPGFVGSPLVAVFAVLALGGVAAVATLCYVRLTGGPGVPAAAPAAAAASARSATTAATVTAAAPAAAAAVAAATNVEATAARNDDPTVAPAAPMDGGH